MSSAAALKAWETRRARAAAGISPAPAPTTPRPVLVLTTQAPPVPRDTSHDETEWQRLADEHQARWDVFGPVAVGVPVSDRPHPRSYGADLPIRGSFGSAAHFTLTPVEKKYLAAQATTIRKLGAHPASYRPDLPLRGLGLGSTKQTAKWTLTATEKKALAARPVRITPDVYTIAGQTESGLCGYCLAPWKNCKGLHRNGGNA